MPLVPSRTEDQAVVLDYPRVLLLFLLSCRVQIDVTDPLTFLCCRQHILAEVVAIHVRSQRPFDVFAYVRRHCRVHYYTVVLVEDENLPLAVHALHRAVVGDGRVAPFGLVTINGLCHERLGKLRWIVGLRDGHGRADSLRRRTAVQRRRESARPLGLD